MIVQIILQMAGNGTTALTMHEDILKQLNEYSFGRPQGGGSWRNT